MSSIDLNLQPFGDGSELAALLLSPALQTSLRLEPPQRALELHTAWRRRFLNHHGGGGERVPASVVDDYADQLIQSLTQWFSLPAWGPLHRALRLQPGLPLRLRIAPDLRALESLPWETLPLGRPLWRLPPQDPVLPVAAGRQRRARLLLLVGEETNLDLQEEVEALGSLARRDRLLLRILRGTAAGAAALRRALEEEPGWDALIFLGHTERDGASGGRLQLGDGTWISGASLEEPLRRAADRGLGLVLLNSCSGIDLAHRCLAAGVAWVQVFREPVPSAAATHAFLQLLRQLEAGHPFHQALTAAASCLEHPPWAGCRGLLSAYAHPEAKPFRWPLPSSRLQRRELLLLGSGAALAGSVGLGMGWAGRAHVGRREWRMATYLGRQDQRLLVAQAPQRLARRLAQLTDGRFQLVLVNEPDLSTSQIFRLVNQGHRYQCGYADIYYDKVLLPLIFAKAVPFGLTPREQTAWLAYRRPGDAVPFHQTVYARLRVEGDALNRLRSFPLSCTGGQMGGWFRREIREAADLDGLRMRIPGLGADVLNSFGVSTDFAMNAGRTIPPSEIVERMRDGRLDAAEWIGPRDDEILGLHQVARYYYAPGWWEPSTTTELMVNTDALEALPADLRTALEAVCSETYQWILRRYDLDNLAALERLKTLGVQLRRFPPPLMAAFAQSSSDLLEELQRQDPTHFGYVHQEWRRFRDRLRATIEITQFRGADQPA